MSIEANRDLVLRFCRHLSALELDAMFALMAPDCSWSWVGKPHSFPFAGSRSKQQSIELLTGLMAGFASWRFDVLSTTAEADRVVIQAQSHGVGQGGPIYENEYIMMFHCQQNQITRIAEFFDQLTVLEFGQAMAASATPKQQPHD